MNPFTNLDSLRCLAALLVSRRKDVAHVIELAAESRP
jgi:hypothetical protein